MSGIDKGDTWRPKSYWSGKGLHDGGWRPQRVAPATPMCWVGEFLRPLWKNEVEIGIIAQFTTMGDVMSIRARPVGDRIAYRVIDEYMDTYEGGNPYIVKPKTSKLPLTFGQYVGFLWALEFHGYGPLLATVWGESIDLDDEEDTPLKHMELRSEFYDAERLNDWLLAHFQAWKKEKLRGKDG